MQTRIVRGVRVATPEGIQAASVHIAEGRIVAIAAYDEVPRLAAPIELGKSVLMPGLVQRWPRSLRLSESREAAESGITTLVTPFPIEGQWVDQAAMAQGAVAEPIELRLRLAKHWSATRLDDARIELLVELLCAAPALAAGLADRKGRIAVGCDADFVIWNPELTVVGEAPLLYGPVRETILRGQTIFKNGSLVGKENGQRLLPILEVVE